MQITETLYISDRNQWRSWLLKNYNKKKEIWLIYYKINSGKPRIPYDEAVEEALCFGWIDSTVKTIDKESYAQRFSIRNQKSLYSQANKERLKLLLKKNMVVKELKEEIKNILNEEFKMPEDILKEIKKNKLAWDNFNKLSDSYRRIRIAFIDASRNRPEMFKKRLDYFIKMTENNRKFGIKGIEKYF
jgi:uncharacterized protein YdeI (YjbR/CyaY-like superfamily)